MPYSIEVLDWFAAIGHRLQNADYNLANQRELSDYDEIAKRNPSQYIEMISELDRDAYFAERMRVYSCSPLMDFVTKLHNLSAAERLMELRDPQSLLRWAYLVIFDHMLGCLLSPQANSLVDLYDAAAKGFMKYKKEHSNQEFTMNRSFRGLIQIWMAILLIQGVKYKIPFERIRKAVWETSVSDMDFESLKDDCPICFEPLCEEDKEWRDANPEPHPLRLALQAVLPESIYCLCNWEEAGVARPSLSKCYDLRRTMMEWDLNTAYDHETDITEFFSMDKCINAIKEFERAFSAKYDKQLMENNAKIRPDKHFAVKLECKHIFHRSCIQSWLETGDRGTCPYCRHDIAKFDSPPYDEDDDDEEGIENEENIESEDDIENEDDIGN